MEPCSYTCTIGCDRPVRIYYAPLRQLHSRHRNPPEMCVTTESPIPSQEHVIVKVDDTDQHMLVISLVYWETEIAFASNPNSLKDHSLWILDVF